MTRLDTTAREVAEVGVILIVRNGERFLADALSSVITQTHQPAEIVVVDGHSTDRTVEIARRFPSVTVIEQAGSGIANAYNQGIAQVRCPLLAFISHDDEWLPEKLELQVNALASRPDALLSFTHVQHVLAGDAPPPGFRTGLLEKPVAGFIMETLLVRREAFDRIGMFDPAFAVAEDTDWFARARDAGLPTVVLPQTLVRKRVHDTNASISDRGINDLLLKALRQSIDRKRNTGGVS